MAGIGGARSAVEKGRIVAVATRRVPSAEKVEFFPRNGSVVVEGLRARDEVQALADRADLIASWHAAHIPKERIQLEKQFRESSGLVTDMLAHLANFDDVLRAHALNPKIVNVIADLLDTDDIALYGDQLFMKPAYHGSAKEWHQCSASFRNIFPILRLNLCRSGQPQFSADSAMLSESASSSLVRRRICLAVSNQLR
ncbi:MAG: phytanoyl-CoA dioxygenase family protein [Actinobacteria bacterium]|nr:phytanoyl-CoA dioxygenase family protein [Actinomycetota bacterium]